MLFTPFASLTFLAFLASLADLALLFAAAAALPDDFETFRPVSSFAADVRFLAADAVRFADAPARVAVSLPEAEAITLHPL
ncbi:hypothetical protein DZF91_26855 [Actinomadura logoneensis]|uniref:Secreted protein n=1 Tax=Actinomadura logoneensis TaxID=2293572 RepID=A0A372JF17_9ACTN|nr:hypothetical protein DZF91_26855 [Actinomadura logoneensis]